MLAKINFKIMAKTTKFILLSKSPWHKNGENQIDFKKSHTWAPFSGISVSCTRQPSVSKPGQTAIFTTV
jgi:hypothetical protein